MNSLPLLMSLAAFIVSAYTFWKTRVVGFKLDVVATERLELTSNPQSPGAKQAGVIMKLLFSNNGAYRGYVHDVAVTICKTSPNSKPVLLRSLFELLEEPLNVTEELPPPKFLAFSSFSIKPGETVVKKVLFVPLDTGIEFRFEQVAYSLTPHTRTKRLKWQKWDAIEIEANEEDLRKLGETVAVLTGPGRQFVAWLTQSKPTQNADTALQELESKISN